jgi:hypothetical protein
MWKTKILALVLSLHTILSTSLHALESNPKNLPICKIPPVYEVGWGGSRRLSDSSNCWASLKIVPRHQANWPHLYTGEMNHGTFDGFGTYTFGNGDVYTGQFEDGRFHGQGTFIVNLKNSNYQPNKDGKYEGHQSLFFPGSNNDDQWRVAWISSTKDRASGIWRFGRLTQEMTADLQRIKKKIAEGDRDKLSKLPERGPSLEVNPNSLPNCPLILDGSLDDRFGSCWGTIQWKNGDRYVGETTGGQQWGLGTTFWVNGDRYIGNHFRGLLGADYSETLPGDGIRVNADGTYQEGIFRLGQFVRIAQPVKLPLARDYAWEKNNRPEINRDRQQLVEEPRRPEEERRQREPNRRSQRLSLIVSNTQPTPDGNFTINVQTNADTASLKINGNEEGGSQDGRYTIRLIARAGQPTTFNITATDVYGNTDTKTITVSRQVVESKAIYAALNPAKVKKQSERDAVAVVIGITEYRSLPKAEYANDDARAFYDYAVRALGVKPENIKLLVDGDAEEAEILKTFRTWVPSRVKSTTDVYVYYSGHGLPTQDGQGLYLLPPRADREVIDDTAIPFSKINAALQLAKPRSVTIFMDACYSGQARSGETLVASARPISLRTENRLFPDGFTVITASQHDQISSSSPDLQHGIFSYYLMRGMEGDADANKDGKITLGEMQAYLSENVGRQAAMMSRKQEPQLIGDVSKVLVGR